MGFVVPPTPSHEDAADVMVRLAQVSGNDAIEEGDREQLRKVPFLLVASCALSTLGAILLVCSIALTCAPHSLPAQAILYVCGAIL